MGFDGAIVAVKKKTPQQHLKSCPACKGQVSKNAMTCPHCGEPLQAAPQVTAMPQTGPAINIPATVGISGAAIVALGTFCPIVTSPLMGSINYFANGRGDGIFLLIFAAMSLLFVALKRIWYLLYTGMACLVILGVTVYMFQGRLNEIAADAERSLAGNPFRGLADAAIGSIHLQFGLGVVLIGAIMLIAAAISSKRYR